MYLRFYMARDFTSIIGDSGRNFTFISFFPDPVAEFLQPYVDAVYFFAGDLKVLPKDETFESARKALRKGAAFDQIEYLYDFCESPPE